MGEHNSTGEGGAQAPGLARIVGPLMAVLTFIFEHLLRKRWGLLLMAAVLGATGRLLSLLSFVAAIKGVFVAMDAGAVSGAIERQLQSHGITVAVTSEEIVLGAAAVVGLTSLLAALANAGRFRSIRMLQEEFVAAAADDEPASGLAYDKFMIERVAPSINNLVRMLEIILFVGAVLVFIAWTTPSILLFLVPILILMPLGAMLAGRKRLRLQDSQRRMLKAYGKGFPRGAAATPEARRAWIQNERKAYVGSMLALRRAELKSQQIATLVMSAALVALVIYLGHAELEKLTLTSISFPFIFTVFAIRQIMTYANEFGANASKLLDLRSGIRFFKSPGTAAEPDDDEDSESSRFP